MNKALAGIFVGGAGTRMGGIAKGLMRTADGTTIVERWRVLLLGLGLDVVLVGEADRYLSLGMEVVPDEPCGIGPLGGLVALLRRAGNGSALAFACDMPFVSVALVDRLFTVSPEAPILAARRGGRWEPLCARYQAARVLPTALALSRTKDHSLQRLLHEAGAIELRLAPEEADQLGDWDDPGDVF